MQGETIYYFSRILKAPEGHLPTCSINSAVVAFSILIHGLALGLYTLGSILTQMPECWQSKGRQTMVKSLLEYFIFISSISCFIKYMFAGYKGHPSDKLLIRLQQILTFHDKYIH